MYLIILVCGRIFCARVLNHPLFNTESGVNRNRLSREVPQCFQDCIMVQGCMAAKTVVSLFPAVTVEVQGLLLFSMFLLSSIPFSLLVQLFYIRVLLQPAVIIVYYLMSP